MDDVGLKEDLQHVLPNLLLGIWNPLSRLPDGALNTSSDRGLTTFKVNFS